jgi:hypothetical protein
MSTVKSNEIIEALLDNLNEGAEEIYQTIAVPEIYWIYLHAKDFQEIQHKSDRIVDEAKKALSDEIKRLNSAINAYEKGIVGQGISRGLALYDHLSGVVCKKPGKRRSVKKKYAEPVKGWQISINADVENMCKEGDIAVKSIIQYGKGIELQGNKTIRLMTMRADDKKIVTREVVDNTSHDHEQTTVIAPAEFSSVSSDETKTFALIHLLTAGGRTTYQMKKSTFAVGRGGPAYWVDLPVADDPKISQEHLRIRRDEKTGDFFIKDLSKNGTELNGRKIPSGIERSDGETREIDVQTKLPDKARIVLAGSAVMEFEILS